MEPSWPKLVEPLEKIVDRLTVVWGMVNHLKSVKDTAELRAAIEEVQVHGCRHYALYLWTVKNITYNKSINMFMLEVPFSEDLAQSFRH